MVKPDFNDIEYSKVTLLERPDVLTECADLYSKYYGIWANNSPMAGQPIKLSASRIHKWFPNENTNLYTARDRAHDNVLIGYAIALRANISNRRAVSWVTQLVVHNDYRQQGIGSHILRHIWGMSNDYAWGIVTSSPFAIRALEKATRRRCDPKEIGKKNGEAKSRADRLLELGNDNIGNYISNSIERRIDESTAQINTNFPADHSKISDRIRDLCKKNNLEWIMGDLQEKWEYFAFTFREQKRFELTKEEINEILENTDVAVKQAYRRMLGGNDKGRPYAKHTKHEIDFVIKHCGLSKKTHVYDFGCGHGRHSIELATRGIETTGVDYIKENIDICKRAANRHSINTNFLEADCRDVSFGQKADAIICLYDIIGSFADEKDNVRIIENIARHLKPGGSTIISVMNSEITAGKVKEFLFSASPNKVFNLKSSSNMGKNGEVFNPKLMLYDRESGVYYRKEQFMQGKELPIELLVCDRRYSKESIRKLCEDAGLIVDFVRYVHAGYWENDLPPTDKHAKEVLVKCTKANEPIAS
ncbi:hypothetical protein FACS1894108_06900 [Planctomycetales bacterium]|nr:hypothetical protein FACS1894108_06900 [Planctomycetales bacterium]